MTTEPSQPAPIPSKETGDYMRVYNCIFRVWMPVLSGEAFKALCCLIDRTWAWGKQEEYISITDFTRALGIPPTHRPVVMRALRELSVFGLIGEGKPGKRKEKAYFITNRILTSNPTLLVDKGRVCLSSNGRLLELVTLRYMIWYPPVTSGSNAPLLDIDSLIAQHANAQAAPQKSKRRAKDISSKTSLKDTNKDIPPSATLQAGAPNVAPLVGDEKEEGPEKTTSNVTTPHIPFKPSGNTIASDATSEAEQGTGRDTARQPEAERQYKAKRAMLNKRIWDAVDHAKTARNLGKYAGWSEADWKYDQREAERELEELDADWRKEQGL